MKRVIFATKNEGKVKEVRDILKSLKVKVLSLSDIDFTGDIVETGRSFEENAKIKAIKIFEKYKVPVIADDSGLVVEQLNGEPGIYSARYAGEGASDRENNDKLLRKLRNCSEPHPAKFVCAAVYYDGIKSCTAIGEVNGRIIDHERGTNGFGYDPLFIPERYTQTTAELEPKVKNKISHRYKAFRKLKNLISAI